MYPLTLISYAGERKERFANIFKNVGPIAQFI